MYKHFIKRVLDVLLSGMSIVLLAFPMLLIAIAIKIDDPGPAFFSQKRIGKGKTTFTLLKFRSMKTSTPHDRPTHLLDDPDRYITKVGRFLRRTSLDELPQIFQIFIGKMSVIGPRPALWNQDDLIVERDKYGANDVKPGLTGWAQINGRDQIPVPVNAELDGEYVQKMSFLFDCKCFFGTVGKVFRGDDIVEGTADKTERSEEKAEESEAPKQ